MKQVLTRAVLSVIGCALVGVAVAQTPAAPAATPTPKAAGAAKSAAPISEQDKVFYALGALLSRNLDGFALSDAEFNLVRRGFNDGFYHKPETASAEANLPQLQALQRSRASQVSQHEKSAGQAYSDKASKAAGAKKTDSGLVFLSLTPGTGASPARTDTVKVYYEGRLIDGTVFDSSKQHGGQPASFPVTGVIACWTEALQLMKVGGKSRIVCPSTIAYGERGAPPKIRPGATLEFDVELLDIVPPPPAPPPAAETSPTPASSDPSDKH
jgi:FKBP-type peptidyl-prolyl cis-trans isomerase FkpA